MAGTERRTIPVPYGHHVYVVSDLSLSPTTDVSSRPVNEFLNLLGDIDDAAVVVIAGNLFHPDSTSDLAKFIEATLAALPEVHREFEAFCANPSHRLFVLPGCDDHELGENERAQVLLHNLGVIIASDLILHIATANGVRDLAVAAGTYELDVTPVDRSDCADADRLEDPQALERFVSSRVLYRRLGAWVWFPILALALLDFWGVGRAVIGHFTNHHYSLHLTHAMTFWTNLLFELVVIVLIETSIAAIAGRVVRRRFDRSARGVRSNALSDPLTLTKAGDVDALEFARRVAERGGAGAVVGGASRPALAFLDNGVCATPGPSRTVLVERHGRFGLPPVFSSFDRLGVVEVEAASTVQVRLIAGESARRRGSLLERLVAGTNTQPAPSTVTTTVASWPSGSPFPVSVERLRDQHRQRVVRRLAAGLIFLDGLVNIAVTTVRPLRSHLHLVLSFFPLEVAKEAAALTAVAGIAMIMLSRGLRRGQRRSWFLSVLLLAITIVAHVLRGGTIVSLLVAAAILIVLVGQRRFFGATTDRSSAANALPRLGLVAFVAVAGATIGVEAAGRHHHLPKLGVVVMACIERLAGQSDIRLPDRVGDFVTPTLLAIGISLVISALYFLTRPVVDRRLSSSASSTERRIAELRARDIVRRHGRGTLDYFALRDDKQIFLFRDSLVAYAVYGGVALISPDPIGPKTERTEVLSAFRDFAESRGWTIGIMAAGEEWLPIYHAAGMHYLYIGDEAIVDCQHFTLAGQKMKGLRQACTRLVRHGYTVEFFDPAKIEPSRVSEIVELISLLRRGGGERGFSMMLGRLFDPKDKGLLLTVVYDPNGKPVAVCQFVPSPAIHGYSLDLMRRDPGEHPNGLVDYALCSTIEHLREQGAQGLSLNFAAFRSVLEGERGEGTFTRVERWALKRLSGILPIESLWTFNSKYQPTWLPRHVVYPAAESFVPVVAAILRAENLTELPVLGRFLVNDPSNRPATIVPEEVLAAAREVDKASSR
ncbi:MAG: bifunctional lysylphosphatidylglycerol flippase/synthetase MprF [Acidimicrobiales bacterium]